MNRPETALAALTDVQQALLESWLPAFVVEHDHSWGLVERKVLEVTHDGERFVVKAGDAQDHHLRREIHAHRHWLRPWTTRARAPVLRYHDEDARLLVTEYLPGTLVLGTPYADDPAAYRQAGELLALLHGQAEVIDEGYEAAQNRRALVWLRGPHRIASDVAERLEAEILTWPTPPATLVPTHGDWQPRNWLVHDGTVSAIDLGRAALRPAMSDLARLAAQEFRRAAALEGAFLEGYGPDPRESAAWHRTQVREAIGTAAWAYQVGDEAFEAQGQRMIAEALGDEAPDDGVGERR